MVNKITEAKKKSAIELKESGFVGSYDVLWNGKPIGSVMKTGANKWTAQSTPVRTRGSDIEVLQREAKAKKK